MKIIKNFVAGMIEKFKPELKEKIDELAKEAVDKLKITVESYNYKSKLDSLVNFVMGKIKLPLWLKPFKGAVKNIIKDTAEAIIEEAKDRIDDKWKNQ